MDEIQYVSVEESRANSESESPKSSKGSKSTTSDKSVTPAASKKSVGGSPASSPEED